MHIDIATPETVRAALPQLIDLIIRTVDDDGSIGWLPPMPRAEAEAYWESRLAAVVRGNTVLLLAWEDTILVGTAQLALEYRPNGTHRGEVQKVMVSPDFRQRGIGFSLMTAIEEQARQHRRSMLFLDTRLGDPSEKLYVKCGYAKVGEIPNYVINPNGSFAPTSLYAKVLGESMG
jgi:acetyltransferase